MKINDLDKRNNLIKFEARKVIIKKILDKLFSTLTYNGKEMSYAEIIELQSKNLVNTLINDEKFKGFLYHLVGEC